MKKKNKGILALAIAIFIILFSNIISSDSSNLFTTSKTCSQAWNQTCNVTTWDDSFKGAGGLNGTQPNGCNGTQYSLNDPDLEIYPHVAEVYINATDFLPEAGINVTCNFAQLQESGGKYFYEYLWYYNTTDWINIKNWTEESFPPYLGSFNKSSSFSLNSSEGEHIVRCIISWNFTTSNPGMIPDECANTTYSKFYDNDDVNFTITDYPKYNFWNLTNYTNGTIASNNQTYNRSNFGNITYINVSANWSKNISFAQIEHNSNGSFVNYTVCSPCSGTWTNYTLNLSNTTEFNRYNTTIKSIHVNDTYGLENSTSPELYFYLSSGIPPNVTGISFYNSGSDIDHTNLFDGDVGIRAFVSDDVGLSQIIANITYPNDNSTNVSMTRESQIGESETWIFHFNDTFPLNETGNFSVKIIAIDIGGQEKTSGIDSEPEYKNLTIYNDYTLTTTIHEPFMRGENITIEAGGYSENPVSNVNWTVNITKPDGNISNFTNQSTYFNYTIQPDDPEGNYSVFAYASKYCDNPECNSGNLTFGFNVSKNLTVYISSSDAYPSKRQSINITSTIYNARGELYTNNASANVSCRDNSYLEAVIPLNFTNGQASITCYAPDAYHYPFSIIINVSDDYNNTGQNYTVLTTESQASSSVPSGSGGSTNFSTSKPKNCTDGTLYNQCSAKRPYYCSNGTLAQKCSICGCPNNTYNCQPAGYCVLTKEEDFNFTLDVTKIELMQGQDFDGKIGSLVNNGKNLLNLIAFINTSEDCCNISISTNYILNEKEEKEVEMSMHVPLFISDKTYLIKIGIGTPILKKERTIELTVKKFKNYNSLIDFNNEITNMENKVQEYKNSGVDTRSLEALVQQSKELLKNVNDSLSSDQATALENSLAELKNNIDIAKPVLSNMLLQGFLFRNSWLIALLVIFSLTTMYMVPQVLLPLNKKEKELTELKEEEKNLVATRIETEKQYFMRKIDENTFTKIMIGKQDKILRTRAAIKEKETERTKIIKSMSPISMFRWFGNSIKNVPKRILNRNNKTISEVNGKNQ